MVKWTGIRGPGMGIRIRNVNSDPGPERQKSSTNIKYFDILSGWLNISPWTWKSFMLTNVAIVSKI